MKWTEQQIDELLANVMKMNAKAKEIEEFKKLPYSTRYYRLNREKLRARKKEWEKANPDKVAGYKASQKARHPEAHKIAAAKWVAGNKDHIRKYQRDYKARNRDRICAAAREYYAKNAADILARRRERYANDPEFRAKCKEATDKSRRKKRQEKFFQQLHEERQAKLQAKAERKAAHAYAALSARDKDK